MAEQEKKPEQKEQPEQQPQEKQGVKKEYVFAAVAVVLIAAAAFLLLQPGEKGVTPAEFKLILNSTRNVAIIMDLRATTPQTNESQAVMNCGSSLSGNLPAMLKKEMNITSYAFDQDGNCLGGANASLVSKPDDCMSEIKKQNRLAFIISYNPVENKTVLFQGSAQFYGDKNFLSNCAIATMFGD